MTYYPAHSRIINEVNNKMDKWHGEITEYGIYFKDNDICIIDESNDAVAKETINEGFNKSGTIATYTFSSRDK